VPRSDRSPVRAPAHAPNGFVAVLPIVAAFVAAHLLCLDSYGIFRDELYYVACSKRLAFGYVDHPPFAMVVLAIVRALFGESLVAFRLVAVALGATHLFLVGALARELGGGRWAQALAVLVAAMSPATLFLTHVYSMNVFEFVFWSAAALALLVAIRRGGEPAWIVLGVLVGLGFENKWSMAWFAGGAVVGLALTRCRGVAFTRGPWLAAAIALALAVPNLLWQAFHAWPTITFMQNAAAFKLLAVSPVSFLFEQVMTLHPLTAPVWIAGLFALFAGRFGSRGRVLAWVWLAVLALLLLRGTGRAVYLLPAYAPLFAAGAATWAGFVRKPLARAIVTVVLLAGGAALAPFGLPLLAPERYLAYQQRLGIAPPQQERGERPALPQYFADMHGWPELAQRVARVWATLSEEERARAAIFTDNYGEAGAIDRFGPALALPRAISGHNQYGLWGPGRHDGSVVITIGGDPADMARNFESAAIADTVECAWCMPYEDGQPIWVGRGLRRPLAEAWPAIVHYE
jgi:hypothetical protein